MPQIPGRRVLGERLGGYIYGTIVVLAAMIEGQQAYRDGTGHVALIVLLTTVVFWLAHVYAHSLAQSVSTGRRVSRRDVLSIAHRESSIIEAAVLPVAMLGLGKLGAFSLHTAVWLAIACAVAVLVAQGLRYARLEHLGTFATAAIVGANLALGLSLVALKLLVGHH